MFRASFVAALVVAAAWGCSSTLETVGAPDAGAPPCKQGPFVFNERAEVALPLPTEQTTNTCSSDNSGQRVIDLLPRGGRFGIGWKVQYIGARDQQGDCNLEVVCTCQAQNTAPPPPPPPPSDAGADADAAPPPAPPPTTPGVPTWLCQ